MKGKRKLSNVQSKVAFAFKAPSPMHSDKLEKPSLPELRDAITKLKYGSRQPKHTDFYYTLDNLVKKVEHYQGFFQNSRKPSFLFPEKHEKSDTTIKSRKRSRRMSISNRHLIA